MAKRTMITFLVIIFLGILIVGIILLSYGKMPNINPIFPGEKEKERFLKYVMCSMAMCSGNPENTRDCRDDNKDICASSEVLSVGIVDKDENGNEITCGDICKNLTSGNCLKNLCGEQYSIEFTFKDSINVTIDEIYDIIRPFGRVMHWCCDYDPMFAELGRYNCKAAPSLVSGLIAISPSSYAQTNCRLCKEAYPYPAWCVFEKNKKVKIYGYESYKTGSIWIFGWEVCVGRLANPRICSNANVTVLS